MKQTIKYIKKNQEVRNGEPLEFNGETIMVGKLSDEEVANLIEEGNKILSTSVKYRGENLTLRDIKSGKTLYNITEGIQLEGNFSALWYAWREARIAEKMEGLTPEQKEGIEKLVGE